MRALHEFLRILQILQTLHHGLRPKLRYLWPAQKMCGKKNTVWSRRAAILDPKFNEEHDARISFGHRARVQQPARAGGRLPGRLLGRQPARAHASNRNRRAHPARSQNSDRACTQSVGFMHARVDGWPRMRWNGLDCQDAAGCPIIALRNLLRANSSLSNSSDPLLLDKLEFVTQKLPKHIEQPAAS